MLQKRGACPEMNKELSGHVPQDMGVYPDLRERSTTQYRPLVPTAEAHFNLVLEVGRIELSLASSVKVFRPVF